jgi:hypothetical protein
LQKPTPTHHDDALVNLLPQVRPEDLDQADLQRRDLAVHEDARQVELHLEADVHVGAVDGGGPPEREAAVGDLVEAGALRVGQLLVLHRLLEAWRGVSGVSGVVSVDGKGLVLGSSEGVGGWG